LISETKRVIFQPASGPNAACGIAPPGQSSDGSGERARVIGSRALQVEAAFMRMSSLALAAMFVCAAWSAPAQVQPQVQPQIESQPTVTPDVTPNVVPKSTTTDQPKTGPIKSQDRVQDQAAPVEAKTPPKPPSRFTFKRVDNSFLRLDHDTGQVAFCRPHDSSWACEAVPEHRAALEKEIAQLQDEVASLKAQVALLTAPPPHPVPPQTVPPPGTDKDGGAQIKLPTAEDIAQARAFLQSAWQRLVDMIGNIQKDVMQKG
jgi:hypothetical protein